MKIILFLATVYNALTWAFNTICETWWNQTPTGSRWILIAMILGVVYFRGDMRGERRERRKHRHHRRRK